MMLTRSRSNQSLVKMDDTFGPKPADSANSLADIFESKLQVLQKKEEVVVVKRRRKKALLMAKCQLEGIAGESLPAREPEFGEIVKRCGDALQAGQGTCLYISGVPGTGKTATVRRAMAYLKELAPQESEKELEAARSWRIPDYGVNDRKKLPNEERRPRGRPRKHPPKDPSQKRPRGRPRKVLGKRIRRPRPKEPEIQENVKVETPTKKADISSSSSALPPFDYVEMNGMKVGEPAQCYSILWQALTGESIGGQLAIRRLMERFSSPHNHRPCIVVLDELDLLLRRKQSVLYHFFEWSGWPHSHLIIVAIANTMDLPERYLSNRIASRLGLGRLYFKPYQHAQLQVIIEHTLTEWKHLFHPDAIEFCARKVSAVSGDARRAIGLARRAVDWIMTHEDGSSKKKKMMMKVTIEVVNRALQSSMSGNLVQVMSNCTRHQKIFLLALWLTIKRQAPSQEYTVDRLCEQHAQLCRTLAILFIPDANMLYGLIRNLINMGLIRMDGKVTAQLYPQSQLALIATGEEVQSALASETIFQRFL